MQRYPYFYSALGALLVETSQPEQALTAYTKALSLTHNPRERAAIQKGMATIK